MQKKNRNPMMRQTVVHYKQVIIIVNKASLLFDIRNPFKFE